MVNREHLIRQIIFAISISLIAIISTVAASEKKNITQKEYINKTGPYIERLAGLYAKERELLLNENVQWIELIEVKIDIVKNETQLQKESKLMGKSPFLDDIYKLTGDPRIGDK